MLTRTILAVTAVTALVGLGTIRSASEYVQVGFRQVGEAIDGQIPVQVEVDRLQLVLEKTDNELSSGRRVRAEAGLRTEKARRELAAQQEKLEHDRKQMEIIRSKLPGGSSACSSVDQGELAKALKTRMERYQLQAQGVEHMETAVAVLETRYAELDETLEARRRDRDLLAQRLAAIRTEKATLELVAGGGGNLPSSDTLARGQALAEKLEDAIALERQLVAPPVDAIDRMLAEAESSEDILADFDRLFADDPVKVARTLD